MKKYKSLVLLLSSVLILGSFFLLATCLQVTYGQDGNNLPDPNELETVMIALTRLDVNDLITDVDGRISDVNDQVLDVNDQTLELRWKIKNNSDRDVWICESIDFLLEYGVDFLLEYSSGSGFDYEAYFEDKDQKFVIRRRLDIPAYGVYSHLQPGARYVRLRAGEERGYSLSLTLPVRPRSVFIPPLEKGDIKHIRHLVIEIGYHTKDLVKTILDLKGSDVDPNLYDEAVISFLSSLKHGEHFLQINVDGVLIPYEDISVEFAR